MEEFPWMNKKFPKIDHYKCKSHLHRPTPYRKVMVLIPWNAIATKDFQGRLFWHPIQFFNITIGYI